MRNQQLLYLETKFYLRITICVFFILDLSPERCITEFDYKIGVL